MQKQVMFYLLENSSFKQSLLLQTDVEKLACRIAGDMWRSDKKVLVACKSEEQAKLIDEALWQLDPEEFVPHNLSSEIDVYKSPVEICWQDKKSLHRRDILISLQETIPSFAINFNHVIDFVETTEEKKLLARERYRKYKDLGFLLNTQTYKEY